MQFCWLPEDLISGLQFLYNCLVAHCDIKLNNLVYSPEFGLQIINFDVVVKLDKDTDMVENIVSTEGYMAPKIDNNQGLVYSSLKADLWSCRQIIMGFLLCLRVEELHEELKQFVSELMVYNLRKRPPLHSWRGDRSMHEIPT